MALYTFYFCKSDGTSTAFEAHELGSDDGAQAFAQRLLLDHPSCSYVEVWEGERPLKTSRADTKVTTAR